MVLEIIGAIGLLLITAGVLTKNRDQQNFFFILGGILLTMYSVYIKDPIFIILQVVFIVAAIYGFLKAKKIIEN